jgi:lysyl endopeptidase
MGIFATLIGSAWTGVSNRLRRSIMKSNLHPQVINNRRALSGKTRALQTFLTSDNQTNLNFQAKCRRRLRVVLLAVLVLAFAVPLLAQQSGRVKELPRSFSVNDKSQDLAERKTLPIVDTQRLIEEDRTRDQDRQHPVPMRFATAINVAFTLTNSGTWVTLSDGRLWRLRIQSAGAKSLSLGITRFDMPDGVKLWIYDPAHTHTEGPYTSRNRSQRGSLWTPIIEGDEIVVEVFVPTGAAQPNIRIGRVNHGYRGFEKGVDKGGFAGTEGTCNNDVICPSGDPWRNQIRAVAVYLISNDLGTGVCTGTLMNDVPVDGTPYFLSANHCLANNGDPASVVVYWNDQAAVCGTHGPGSTTQNQLGATLRANYAPSDFALFELSATPDPLVNVLYSGWDATPGIAPTATVGIHQPRGDVKAISFSNTAPRGADWTATGDGGTLNPAGNHWRIDWDSGVTEGGSSGSCIFETTNGRCIGQLHGGPSACGSAIPSATEHDYYGMLSVSWYGGGTDATQLRHWLDPGNTGVTALDGDPHITTSNGIHYDFQGAGEYVSAREGEMEIQTRITPIATTFFPGPDPHDGLASCVSVISAVAMRIGTHRVTYEPNLSGVPDPSGMQLRVDGVVTTLGSAGIDLGGGRITPTSAPGGLEVHFPNGHVSFITPGFWTDQGKWYLYVDIDRARAVGGADGNATGTFGPSGIAGAVPPGSWLPRLPDGTSMGPMPAAISDRFTDLYQKFGGAWRVTDAISLFDYAPGTSTATFTMLNWPLQSGPCVVPRERPAAPASEAVAERACSRVKDRNSHRNCVFDVRVTGNTGFATTYIQSQDVLTGTTTPTAPTPASTPGKWAVFLDAGAGFPHSPYSNFLNTGFSFNAGLEYMVTSNFSVEGIFGYHRFPSSFVGAHTNVFQFSGNAKFYLLPSPNTVRPFLNGGIGAYTFSPGTTTRFGGNVGAGLLFELTPRVGVQGSYNFHMINTSGTAFKFSTVQGGVRFVF